MIHISQTAAVSKLIYEFNRRGWCKHLDIAMNTVTLLGEQGQERDFAQVAKSVPLFFLKANGIKKREDLRFAFENVFADCFVCPQSQIGVNTNVYGDSAQVFIGSNDVTHTKNIQINNEGQFAGNVDSPDAKVEFRRQQQVVTKNQRRRLDEAMEHPEVRELMATSLSKEEKESRLAPLLSKLTDIPIGVLSSYVTQVLSKMIS